MICQQFRSELPGRILTSKHLRGDKLIVRIVQATTKNGEVKDVRAAP